MRMKKIGATVFFFGIASLFAGYGYGLLDRGNIPAKDLKNVRYSPGLMTTPVGHQPTKQNKYVRTGKTYLEQYPGSKYSNDFPFLDEQIKKDALTKVDRKKTKPKPSPQKGAVTR